MKKHLTTSLMLAALTSTPLALAQADTSHYEFYGFAQLDAILDFGRMDPAWKDTTRPSKIDATDSDVYGSSGEAAISIRQSRIGFKADLPSLDRPTKIWFEWDYFGGTAESPDFRVRHLFVEYGQIGAGQTWTGFMDIDIFPNTIDYWGPNGMIFIRKEQLRYHMPLSEGSNLFFTLEDPDADIDCAGPCPASIKTQSLLPDITARYRQDGSFGHWQLAGILRYLKAENTATNNDDTAIGFGVNATTALNVGDNGDKVKLGLVLGQGIAGNFNDGGNTLAFDGGTGIEAVKSIGLSAFYDHNWDKQWSSSLGFSLHNQNNADGQGPAAYKAGNLAQANLLYTEGNFLNGVELIYSNRKNENGDSNSDLRIQYSFKYSFSKIF